MSRINILCGFVLVLYIGIIGAAPSNQYNEGTYSEFKFNISGFIQDNGYPAEDHNVLTEDGYILEMQRIPYGINEDGPTDNKPVVFMMHGLMGSATGYIALGPEYAMGYVLADAGFDVWMGNARGTRNSRFHLTLDPDHEEEQFEFFDFTWEEIGMIDVAAMVDYILEYTGREKIHYIGHSQGGTVFLVLASMRPEYNDKFYSAHLLAGVGYMEYFPNTYLRLLARNTDNIFALALYLGLLEVFPPNSTGILPGFPFPNEENRMSDYCLGDLELKEMCDLFGIHEFMPINDDDFEYDFEYESGGAALKQIAHYGQNVRDKVFRRYDHGSATNLLKYGTEIPPEYDLSLITTNTTMHYTIADDLLDERDVLAMAEVMPNTIVRKVADDTFSHTDFSGSRLAKELVTVYIIDAMNYFNDYEESPPVEEIAIESGSTLLSGNLMIVGLICINLVLLM